MIAGSWRRMPGLQMLDGGNKKSDGNPSLLHYRIMGNYIAEFPLSELEVLLVSLLVSVLASLLLNKDG
jgi:hypothetical protein